MSISSATTGKNYWLSFERGPFYETPCSGEQAVKNTLCKCQLSLLPSVEWEMGSSTWDTGSVVQDYSSGMSAGCS